MKMSEENQINNNIEKSDNILVKTILFSLMNGIENIDSCLRLANVLQEKGLKIVFALDQTSSGVLDENCVFDKYVYDCKPLKDFSKGDPELDLNCLNGTAIEKIKNFSVNIVAEKFEFVRRCEDFNEDLIDKIKPNLIIVESMICSPILTNCGIPWIWLNFGPPNICKNDKRLPPGWSGISIKDMRESNGFREQWNQIFSELNKRISNWCTSRGAPDLPDGGFHPQSPFLNIYVHPSDLDYKLSNTWELKNWLQMDSLLENNKLKSYTIPDEMLSNALKLIKNGTGKLIYLSMGPFASVDLMKRLTKILSESKNRFIVSKGPFHNSYELPDNMWGSEEIPLKNVINEIELVISCGDNKTIFECLLNAKPIIVLPLIGDQIDYRIRLKECGFGWGLDPFTCEKATLICMIDSTLDDKSLSRRLNTIADSMKRCDSCKRIADEVELLLNPNKKSENINMLKFV